MKSTFRVFVAGLGLLCLAAPAIAHHAFSVEYDAKKRVEREGVISKVEWTNPHMRIYVDVKDEKGVVTTWNLELGSPNSVVRRGWTREHLQPGGHIKFAAYAGRVVEHMAAADAITLPDGRAFTGAAGDAPDAPR